MCSKMQGPQPYRYSKIRMCLEIVSKWPDTLGHAMCNFQDQLAEYIHQDEHQIRDVIWQWFSVFIALVRVIVMFTEYTHLNKRCFLCLIIVWPSASIRNLLVIYI